MTLEVFGRMLKKKTATEVIELLSCCWSIIGWKQLGFIQGTIDADLFTPTNSLLFLLKQVLNHCAASALAPARENHSYHTKKVTKLSVTCRSKERILILLDWFACASVDMHWNVFSIAVQWFCGSLCYPTEEENQEPLSQHFENEYVKELPCNLCTGVKKGESYMQCVVSCTCAYAVFGINSSGSHLLY